MDTEKQSPSAETPPKNASWGAILSIIVILAMIVIGAFYAWDKRTDEQKSLSQPTEGASSTASEQSQ